MDYIGYFNETAHTMIMELRTHPVVLNPEKREIRSFFVAPWSDSPDMTLEEYGRKIDKRQRAAKNQGVTIYDKDKTMHFAGCAEDSGLFKEEWVTEWEATPDRSWTVVRDIWVVKWLEITRAATMAEKRGGYKSAAAMRGTRATPTPFSATEKVTWEEYDAVSEYACALKAESAELKSGGGDDVTTVSTLEAASAATETTTGIIAEMRAVNAEQMRETTALVAAATDGNIPAPPRKKGQAQAQTQIHMNPAGTRSVRYPPP